MLIRTLCCALALHVGSAHALQTDTLPAARLAELSSELASTAGSSQWQQLWKRTRDAGHFQSSGEQARFILPMTVIPELVRDTLAKADSATPQKSTLVLYRRDFAPRVSSALYSGLTADCTQLVIGDHKDAKTGTEYKNLLYQIRPAFGGNIIATIVNPDNRPQMATVREGVMRREYAAKPGAGEVKKIQWQKFVKDADLAVKIIDREIAESKIDIKGAGVIVAGGYGMGSKENFDLVFELADVLGAEVGASRAAVDAGFADHARQVGQTGVTVRPKLYIACGISGQIQHTAGMDGSAMVISINTDPEAPINKIADYAITGDVNEVIPKMIKYYKQNSK
mgnify:CR=1 FL=1